MKSTDIKNNNICLPLKVGQSFSRTICFDEASVKLFATLVGDPNPLHHDKEAAKKSRFGRIIASGTQTSSILAAMVASELCRLRPSLGLKISFCFKRPVYTEVEMNAKWEIISIEPSPQLGGDIITFSGQLTTMDFTLLVSGTAVSLVQWN